MEFVITASYEDIFNDKRPEISNLLSGIPSSVILRLLSYFDSQLFLNEDLQTQFKLLKVLLKRQTIDSIISLIHNYGVLKKNAKESEISILSRLYIKSFIHYELINYRELPTLYDTTPTQELNIFKAYLIIASIKSSEIQNFCLRKSKKTEDDFFSTHTWPMIINQLDANTLINPIPQMIRGICLLNYLQYHSNYSKYVDSFLEKKELSNSWEYIITLSDIVQSSWDKSAKGDKRYSFNCPDKFESLFDNISIDPSEYRAKYLNKKEEYSLLKSKPLFKLNKTYYVLDWNFMPNKIYEGLIFDFYNESGIKELKSLNSIPKFKKLIGYEITEKLIFRTLLRIIFKDKYSKLIFSEKDSNGEPDAYYRKGNNVILFEIKDSFFPTSAINSSTFEDIKSAIDEKYNTDKKGTGQLLKQMNRVKDNSFEDRDYNSLKLKARNFNIYPVLIYTDKFFGMGGVSNYLIKELDNRINQADLRKSFKKINNLTFLSLDYLILHSKFLGNNNFIKIIDKLHQVIDDRKKKEERIKEVPVLLRYNENIEQILKESHKTEDNKEMDIEEIANALNITEGLPKGE